MAASSYERYFLDLGGPRSIVHSPSAVQVAGGSTGLSMAGDVRPSDRRGPVIRFLLATPQHKSYANMAQYCTVQQFEHF